MKTVKYREEHRYNDYLVYVVLAIFGVLVFSRVMRATQGDPLDGWSVAGIALFVLMTGLVVWYLTHLRFTIRMNEKNLKIGYDPFQLGSRKIKWKDVRDIALIRPPKHFNWSGMNVHFSKDYTYYDLNGRGLLRLVLDNDEVICVGIKKWKDMRRALDKITDKRKNMSYDEVDMRHESGLPERFETRVETRA